MFIPFWILLATAGAQDYASEVLYPDDLIPAEDREGKFRSFIFIYCNLVITAGPDIDEPTTTSTTTTTTVTQIIENGENDRQGTIFFCFNH